MSFEVFQAGEMEEELRKADLQANGLSSWFELFKSTYTEFVDSISVPVRANYSMKHLGESKFQVPRNDTDASTTPLEAVREDFMLKNKRQEVLYCSMWMPLNLLAQNRRRRSAPFEPLPSPLPADESSSHPPTPSARSPLSAPKPCIVYLHGMSSSRKECVYFVNRVLAKDFSIVSFDFSGSGMSEGDRFSFGYYERDDLEVLINHLYASGKASKVYLWGRAVGATTALMYLQANMTRHYKTWRLSRRDAAGLRFVHDAYTGKVHCARASSVGLPFRMSRIGAANGDFVVLAINDVELSHDMTAEACTHLVQRSGDRVRIIGYHQPPKGPQNKFISSLVLDSGYGDLQQVISDSLREVSKSAEKRNLKLPETMLSAASKIISRSVYKSANYYFTDVNVLASLPDIKYPSLFVCTKKKDFISPEHTLALYEAYGGSKSLVEFDGEHDANRPPDVIDSILQFLSDPEG